MIPDNVQIKIFLSSDFHEISDDILSVVLDLAESEGGSLAAFRLRENSKIASILKAKVRQSVKDNLQPFIRTVELKADASDDLAGLVVAFDIISKTIVGFIDFNPRRNTNLTGSIGVIVVTPTYRRKGVMRVMLETLKKVYPVLVLDCSLRLVPVYEHLGFSPIAALGANVMMCNGVADGDEVERKTLEDDKKAFETFRERVVHEIDNFEYRSEMNELKLEEKKQIQKVAEFFEKRSAC